MPRTATCSCGQLSIAMNGEPAEILVCHCLECQKSTGSVFGTASYWGKDAIAAITGASTLYRRSSDSGRWVDNYFCPRCGSTVYWYLEVLPDVVGISVGNFADPKFPAPRAQAYAAYGHAWADAPHGVPRFKRQYGAAV